MEATINQRQLVEFGNKLLKEGKKVMYGVTDKSLKTFGKYLLSKKRNQSVSAINRNEVTDADLENWNAPKVVKQSSVVEA